MHGQQRIVETISSDRISTKREPVSLSVVIPTYNRAESLGLCLDSLSTQDTNGTRFEVVVVDDGCTDTTREMVTQRADGTKLMLQAVHECGVGAAAARNSGIRAAAGDIVLLLDDDVVAAPDLVDRHLDFHRQWPDLQHACLGLIQWPEGEQISVLADYITSPEGGQLVDWSSVRAQDCDNLNWQSFWSGNLSVKRGFLLHKGLFDDTVFTRAIVGEDIELGRRLLAAGLMLHFREDCLAFFALQPNLADMMRRQRRIGRSSIELSRLGADPGYEPGPIQKEWVLSGCALDDIVHEVEGFERTCGDAQVLRQVYGCALHYAILVGRAEGHGKATGGVGAVVALLATLAACERKVQAIWKEKDKQIAELRRCCRDKENEMVGLGRKTRRVWSEKDNALAEQGRRLNELENRVQNLSRKLADVEGSRSWRWTSPVRRVISGLKRIAGRI